MTILSTLTGIYTREARKPFFAIYSDVTMLDACMVFLRAILLHYYYYYNY